MNDTRYRIQLTHAGWPARYKARLQACPPPGIWTTEWNRYGRTRGAAIRRAQKDLAKLRKIEERNRVIETVYPE